jgi:hypothetical protein
VEYAFPAVLQSERTFGTRHHSALMFAVALRAEAEGYATGAAEQRRFVAEVAEDIVRRQPKAVFVDDQPSCVGCPPGFRLSTPFLADVELGRALAAYADRGLDRGFRVFTRTP